MLALAPSFDPTDGSEGPALFRPSTRLLALSFLESGGARTNAAMVDGGWWMVDGGDDQ